MEPLLAATVALGTVVGTKVLEKTGEGIGEAFVKKTKEFLTNLNKVSPNIEEVIEKAIVKQTPDKPINYSEISDAIEVAIKKRPELLSQIQELAELGQQEPKLSPYIIEAVNNLMSVNQSNPSIVNNSKLADEIKNSFQGSIINNPTFN